MGAPNVVGTHLPTLSVKDEVLTDLLKKQGPIKLIAVIPANTTCGELCPISTAKSKLFLA